MAWIAEVTGKPIETDFWCLLLPYSSFFFLQFFSSLPRPPPLSSISPFPSLKEDPFLRLLFSRLFPQTIIRTAVQSCALLCKVVNAIRPGLIAKFTENPKHWLEQKVLSLLPYSYVSNP